MHDPRIYGWPPKNARLSDTWVVMAILYCSTKDRATRWPADFETGTSKRPPGEEFASNANVSNAGLVAMIEDFGSWLTKLQQTGDELSPAVAAIQDNIDSFLEMLGSALELCESIDDKAHRIKLAISHLI